LPLIWAQMLEAVGRASPFTKTYLVQAHPVSLTRNVLTIGFDPELAEHLDMVNNQKTHALLHTKLAEFGHPGVQVKFVQAEAPSGYVPPVLATSEAPEAAAGPTRIVSAEAPAEVRREKATASAPPSAEEFKKDPLIQKALEIFKGQIVEVRA